MTPPAFRFDITIEEDLIEEVGRMVGYDEIPVDARDRRRACSGCATESRASTRIGSPMRSSTRGYAEVVTYSFVDAALDAAVSPGAEPVGSRIRSPATWRSCAARCGRA